MKFAFILCSLIGVVLTASSGLAQDSLGVTRVGSLYFPNWGNTYRVSTYGNYAAVVTLPGRGFRIVDIGDPANPREIWHIDTLQASDVAIDGSHAYVGSDSSKFFIFNIADPEHPELVGSIETVGPVSQLIVEDSKAYLVCPNLNIYDVSQPDNPELVGQWGEHDGELRRIGDMDAVNNLLYLADGGGMHILDLTVPHAAREIALFDPDGGASFVSVLDNLAVVRTWDAGVYIIDISDPESPSQLGLYEVENVREVELFDDRTFITGSNWGMSLVDISDPANPSNLGYYPCGWVSEVSFSNHTAWVAATSSGLMSLDVTDPINPAYMGSCGVRTSVTDVYVDGNLAYVALGKGGLSIVDVADLTAPVEISRFLAEGRLFEFGNLAKKGNFLFVANSQGAAMVVDVSDPVAPREVRECPDIPQTSDLMVSGNLLFATRQTSVVIANVINSQFPRAITYLDIGAIAYVAVQDTLMYVAGHGRGLCIFNIQDPNEPQQIGISESNLGLYSIAVQGNYAYLSSGQNGLLVFDVSNPANPHQISAQESPVFARKVVVHGNYAFVSEEGYGSVGGICVIDIRDPRQPQLVGFYNSPGTPSELDESNGYVFLADGDNVGIYDCREVMSVPTAAPPFATDFTILSAFPNPFNSSTTIQYSVPNSGRYAIDVIDIQGRLVTRLSDGWREAGCYHQQFSATGLPSGQFNIELRSGMHSEFRSVTLIK